MRGFGPDGGVGAVRRLCADAQRRRRRSHAWGWHAGQCRERGDGCRYSRWRRLPHMGSPWQAIVVVHGSV